MLCDDLEEWDREDEREALGGIMISEISQSQKDKYCMILLRYLKWTTSQKQKVE